MKLLFALRNVSTGYIYSIGSYCDVLQKAAHAIENYIGSTLWKKVEKAREKIAKSPSLHKAYKTGGREKKASARFSTHIQSSAGFIRNSLICVYDWLKKGKKFEFTMRIVKYVFIPALDPVQRIFAHNTAHKSEKGTSVAAEKNGG